MGRSIGEQNEYRWAQSWAWDPRPWTQGEKLWVWEYRFGMGIALKQWWSQRRVHPQGAPRRPGYRGTRS